MTTRPARKSLAAAFASGASTDRSHGLQGLLPPRPGAAIAESADVPTPPRSAVRAVQSVAEADGIAPAASVPLPQEVHPDGGAAAGSAADVVRSVAVYLPIEVLERLRTTARSREMTYAELLVEAAAAHLDAAAGSFVSAPPVTTGMPSRTARRRCDPGVQVQLRLDGHQVFWLDRQADRLGAPSRTALVVALLRQHLGASGASE